MPINKNANIRFLAIDRCLKNTGRIYHIDDLVKVCNEALTAFNGQDSIIKKRQVYNDIRYMKSEEGYAAPIERYKKGNRVYFRYENRDFSINNQPVNEAEAHQIQAALSVFQRFRGLPQFEWLQEILPKMQAAFGVKHQDRAVFQFEHNIYLKGIKYVEKLYQHIIQKEVLRITFRDFDNPIAAIYTLHPYMLKQYNKRWFLISQNHQNDRIWVTALDRIEQIVIINDIIYRKNAIDLEEYFDDVIGVTKYKDEVLKKIQLKVHQKSVAYVRTKPLHPSQKKIELTNDYMIIELKLMWNYELESLILSFGNQMEVLAPLDFRTKIAERIKAAKNLYD